ncbi:hypothetical protein HNP99_002814 [Flavobacterium sp. 28A]|uniref:T9SS type A sorting domain-containing protein n=1 Tax=Flavobacterium sp. 28A TaxID=2735895 RepID=UPI0015708050|nr:T9SS type A sorting domain-containing protein [Flavobacterium sp. 28A]NRT16447.1 hypothetical protein [Flavobacterium sp. 28A]
MKKIYLLLLLLVSGFSYAQVNLKGEAYYKLSIIGKVGGGGSGSCGTFRGLQWISSEFQVNSRILNHFGTYKSNSQSYMNQSINYDIIYYENDPIVKLHFGTVNRKGNPKCTSYYNSGNPAVTRSFSRIYNFTEFENIDAGDRQISGEVTITSNPVINLSNPDTNNNIIGTESSIKVPAITGVKNEYFNWMYHIDGEGYYRNRTFGGRVWVDIWRALPADYQQKNSLDIKCQDFLPIDAVGKKIWLRANTNGNTVELLYAKSAPLIESVNALQTSCFDSEDGRIILKFNSKLITGETLTCSVLSYDPLTGDEQGVFYSTQDGQSITIGDDLTYEIPYDFLKGKYHVNLLGWYKEPNKVGANTYVKDSMHEVDFIITSPAPVDFSIKKKNDIYCYGNSDGVIDIVGSGGISNGIFQYSTDGGNIWITFLEGEKTSLSSLPLGDYFVNVRKLKNSEDTVGCIAMNPDGTYKIETITISQPKAALKLEYTLKEDPTFFGAANGKIVAAITGGTIKDDHTYNFEWEDKNGNPVVAKGEYNAAVETYYITLDNASDGEYTLTVTDKNYNVATDKAGCSIIESKQILTQPEEIVITIDQTQAISCNSASLNPLGNGNKIADAILTAQVKGGIPFTGSANNGLPYKFIWSKYNVLTDSWEILSDKTTKEAKNLTAGKYSLNVEDAKGNVQGTYSTTQLELANPTEFEIIEPLPILITFTSSDVSCYQGNNGLAVANVEGGAGGYTYEWFNTAEGIINGNTISQLVAGTYTVEVTDKNDCFAKASIVIIGPPSSLSINYKDIITPTFAGATNGKITAEVSGGTAKKNASYNYVWTNSNGIEQTAVTAIIGGVFTISLDNLGADDYFLTVKDENYDALKNQIINCSVLESKVTLNEPEPLKVVFEVRNTISCNSGNQFGNNIDVTPNDGQRDESQDGILIAHVTGGTPLAAATNNGLLYYFYWKKQLTDGSWVALPDIKGETASNLSHGNYALNIKDRNGIVLGTYANNLLTQEIDAIQFMQEPSKLSVTITKDDVFCNGGNDGWATANVVGGTPPYNYNWSNGVSVFENTILKAGKYVINITDAKGCATQNEVTIIEPIAPIIVKVEKTINPSFYQATNGEITVTVKGGTLLADNSYWFEWKNSKGVVQNLTTTTFIDGIYTIKLSDLPEETYNLTIRDANYNLATSKMGCTVLNTTVSLEDPDPLEVTFEIVNTISCHVDNEFGNEKDTTPADSQRDESQDGILVAHVKGGIKLEASQNNGLPYFYTWKKQKGDGTWGIWNDQDETAQNVSEGTYALNIEDANGIKLGTYTNNVLVKEIDVTQYMQQPTKLNLTFTKFDVGCTAADDGWAEAHVTGGTAPYSFQWTNEATTQRIDDLTTNNYFVLVTDAKGCSIQGSIFVGDPDGVIAIETIKNPTCFQGNDGSINLDVTGGNSPYTYKWSTGATTKNVQNLAAGNYEVEIMCPDCCVYKKKFVLKNPEQIFVNVGEDRTLCIGQTLDLDATNGATNATYSWTSTNGFTSNEAKVTLSKAGTYRIKVTSALGCIGEDEITIKTSQNAISSEFLLSSQAYLDEEVILVNTSDPFGESSQWEIPSGVTIVEQKEKYITLKFDAVGTYTLGLQQTQGDCFATYTKNIVVEARTSTADPNSNSKFITGFIVAPNPSDGNFKAYINFEETSTVNLRLFSGNGQFTAIQKKDSGKKKYEIDFNTSLSAGIYILVLETEQQTLVKKIIIY